MNKGIRVAFTAAAATWAANVATANAEMNTSIPWSAGSGTMAGGVALADGKVQVYCDASGNVTNLVAKPAGGETLTLTGDAMTFAAGAKITFAAPSEGAVAGGRLVFANDVTADGALGMTRSDGAYVVWSGTPIETTAAPTFVSTTKAPPSFMRVHLKISFPSGVLPHISLVSFISLKCYLFSRARRMRSTGASFSRTVLSASRRYIEGMARM